MKRFNKDRGYFRNYIKYIVIQVHKYLKQLEKENLCILEFKIDVEIHWFDKDNTERKGFLKINNKN
jgi:hypothetical protein